MQSGEQPSQLCGMLYGSVTELRHHLTPLDPDLPRFEITGRSLPDLWITGPDLANVAPSFISASWRERYQPAGGIHHIYVPVGTTETVSSVQTRGSMVHCFLGPPPPHLIPVMCGTNL